jgi:hypothetical protein
MLVALQARSKHVVCEPRLCVQTLVEVAYQINQPCNLSLSLLLLVHTPSSRYTNATLINQDNIVWQRCNAGKHDNRAA